MSHVLLVRAQFYTDIADMLTKGAADYLKSNGYSYDVIDVPGAFEIPAAISFAAESGQYEGFVALGCVIQGETTHYDYVCGESARALMDLSTNVGLAIGNGILTVNTMEQAVVRADPAQKNKGAGAAEACVSMLKLKQQFGAIA